MRKIILTTIALLMGLPVFAQEPLFLINWGAHTFVPSFYQGKALPVGKADVRVSFDIIENGSSVSLRNKEVQWFLDERPIAAGPDLKQINISLQNVEDRDALVRVQVRNFKNRSDLVKTFLIPVTAPDIVIDLPQTSLTPGVTTVKSWPFFFNVSKLKDLVFSWLANGKETRGDVNMPNNLELELPPEVAGSSINLAVTAQNRFNLLESARKALNLLVR